MESNTPKNFVLQLGSLIFLYVTIVSLNVLLFSVITLSFPDTIDSYWQYDSASSATRLSIATLIVFFPAFILVTRVVNQMKRSGTGLYSTLTKWLIYLSILVGSGVLLGDFVAIINSWLEGEITIRFILKALVLALTIGFALYYYILDVKGYWQANEKKSLTCSFFAILVVVTALIIGFMHTETPQEVRDMSIDDNQVTDLQAIERHIEEYYRVNEQLPETLKVVFEGFTPITAPESRSAYVYEITDDTHYKLCAEFIHESDRGDYERMYPTMDKNYNWTHGAGQWCFQRVVETKTTE